MKTTTFTDPSKTLMMSVEQNPLLNAAYATTHRVVERSRDEGAGDLGVIQALILAFPDMTKEGAELLLFLHDHEEATKIS